jgi:hypothetical protein
MEKISPLRRSEMVFKLENLYMRRLEEMIFHLALRKCPNCGNYEEPRFRKTNGLLVYFCFNCEFSFM